MAGLAGTSEVTDSGDENPELSAQTGHFAELSSVDEAQVLAKMHTQMDIVIFQFFTYTIRNSVKNSTEY